MSKEEEELHKQIEKKINIKKPLIAQVKKLTNKEFMFFVKRPRFMESQDGIQLWDDKDFDQSRKMNWHTNLKVITPVVLVMIYVSYYNCADLFEFLTTFAIWFTFGLTSLWTLLEYVQHRFILHKEIHLDPNEPWTAAGGERNAEYFSRHIHHHVFMNQRYRIALRLELYPQYIIPITIVAHLFLYIFDFSPRAFYMLGAGWVTGSLAYDGIHLAFHFDDMY